MRLLALLTIGILASAFMVLSPTVEARTLYCTELNPTCDGLVCADANLDNRFQNNECVVVYCLHWGQCCASTMCPQPY